MCDVLTLSGLALEAAGGAAKYAALGDVARARSGVLAAERQRQAGYNAETDALNNQARGRFDDFSGQQTTNASKLVDMFKNPQGSTESTPPAVMPKSNSEITNTAIKNRSDVAKTYTDQQADALGNLRSFGETMGGINRGVARDAGLIGEVNGFKTGSSNAAAYELENANNAGNGAAFLGGILGGLGKIGVTAGLSGGASKIASMFGAPAASAARVAGAPLNLLPNLPQSSVFVTGASPFQTYGV